MASLIMILFACGVGVWWAWLNDYGLCDVTEIAKVPSPQGDLVAIVFEKDCGATTSFNTQIALVRNDAWAHLLPLHAFVVVNERGNLHPVWVDNNKIRISLPQNDEVYLREKHALGVTISYD